MRTGTSITQGEKAHRAGQLRQKLYPWTMIIDLVPGAFIIFQQIRE